MKINLGCANNILEGYDNVDCVNLKGVDIIQDLNKEFWENINSNKYEEVYARFILEHLDNNIKNMEEIWRISKQNAIIKIWVPYWSSHYTWDGQGHKRGYTITSFDCFEEGDTYEHYSNARFIILKKEYEGGLLLKFLKKIKLHLFFIRYFNNICSTLYFELEAIK